MTLERIPFKPLGEEWTEAFAMLCGVCKHLGECQIIEGMIEMKDGAPWPQGGWVTDPGAGITCLSYQPKPVRILEGQELEDALNQAVPMCGGCAARKGSEASKSLHTQRDFHAAVKRQGVFACHEGNNHGKPCGGWCNAVRRQMNGATS
ncbi:hypothetical protein ACT3UJ_12545 [Halomonas sp. 86]|uniref:hypothetical protein n=1 Tax=unclassified Halomonas TaxID=2609666 RepID=UPI004034D5CF